MYHVFSFLPIASLTHAGLQKKRVVHSLTLNWITMGVVRARVAAQGKRDQSRKWAAGDKKHRML